MDGKVLTRRQLETRSHETVDIPDMEIALALQIMDHDGDNIAHFGINGCFIFSRFDKTIERIQ